MSPQALQPVVRGVNSESLGTSLKQHRKCTYNVTFRSVRITTVDVEKQSITYYECVFVALIIQHAKRMCRIILSSVACPALLHFSTLSHKRYDFRERNY